jgi:hypothetical protein
VTDVMVVDLRMYDRLLGPGEDSESDTGRLEGPMHRQPEGVHRPAMRGGFEEQARQAQQAGKDLPAPDLKRRPPKAVRRDRAERAGEGRPAPAGIE